MKTSEVLEAARELIADPSRWGQGGSCCHPGTLCLVEAASSAMAATSGSYYGPVRDALWAEARRRGCEGGPVVFNDTHTHDQVMSLLDSAISGAKIRETAASSCASASVPGGGQDQT